MTQPLTISSPQETLPQLVYVLMLRLRMFRSVESMTASLSSDLSVSGRCDAVVEPGGVWDGGVDGCVCVRVWVRVWVRKVTRQIRFGSLAPAEPLGRRMAQLPLAPMHARALLGVRFWRSFVVEGGDDERSGDGAVGGERECGVGLRSRSVRCVSRASTTR